MGVFFIQSVPCTGDWVSHGGAMYRKHWTTYVRVRKQPERETIPSEPKITGLPP
jgi:hypothetical protein